MALEGMFVEYAGWRMQEGLTVVKWQTVGHLRECFKVAKGLMTLEGML
jgi:hypothetical protein